MSGKPQRVVVQKIKPSKSIVHENSFGIQAIRYDYKNSSRVDYVKEGFKFRSYFFDKVTPVYESPYLSWANLDCCGGWAYDESYLQTAVQSGKKLYAGMFFYISQYGSIAKTKDAVSEFLENIPSDCVGGLEEQPIGIALSFYVCRKGSLSDYFNLNEVLDYYERLGVLIDDTIRSTVQKLASIEISKFATKDAPFDYSEAYDTASLIVTGLLFGYPIESTASIIQGY